MSDLAGTRNPAPSWARRGLLGLTLLLAALPILFHVLRVPDYGRMQRDDYWGLLFRLSDGERLKDTAPSYWNARINQHRVTIPALIWRANIALFHGDNRTMAFLALAFLVALGWLCLRQLPRPPSSSSDAGEPTARLLEKGLAAVLLAWAICGPQMTYNLGKSFGGVHYFLADLCSVGAMAALIQLTQDAKRRLVVIGLGLVGIFTFSSALAAWPALLMACWWLRRPLGDYLAVIVGAAISVFFFLQGFSSGAGDVPGPAALLDYLTVFLGAVAQQDLATTRLIGALGLGLFACLAAFLAWRRDAGPPIAFWLMAATYGAGNGLLAGLGRAGAGPEQAMAIRYVLFPSLFWASLLIAFLLAGRLAGLRRLGRGLLIAVLAFVAFGAAAEKGMTHSRTFIEGGRWQKVIEMQLRHGAWDAGLMRFAVTPFPPAVISDKRRPVWQHHRHIPWDRPAETPPNRHLDPRQVRESEQEGGFTELIETANPNIQRVGGWIPKEADIEEIVFADATGRQRGLIHLWPHPKFEDKWQWAGLVMWHGDWKTWTPFAVHRDGTFSPIRPERYVASRWQELFQARRRSPNPIAAPAISQNDAGSPANGAPDASAPTPD